MRAPALRSSAPAIELNWTEASKLPPSPHLNPVPGCDRPQISDHESSGISPSAFCKNSSARHEIAVQIFWVDASSGLLPDFQRFSCLTKIVAHRLTRMTADADTLKVTSL